MKITKGKEYYWIPIFPNIHFAYQEKLNKANQQAIEQWLIKQGINQQDFFCAEDEQYILVKAKRKYNQSIHQLKLKFIDIFKINPDFPIFDCQLYYSFIEADFDEWFAQTGQFILFREIDYLLAQMFLARDIAWDPILIDCNFELTDIGREEVIEQWYQFFSLEMIDFEPEGEVILPVQQFVTSCLDQLIDIWEITSEQLELYYARINPNQLSLMLK